MSANARENHTSPGIYQKETQVVTKTTTSLGLTTLGLVGETMIGPAFQPFQISTWKDFVTYFGDTNAEKFKNGYPKYELPYIAKEYLKQSQQLYVTKVLGLSGFKYDGLWVFHLKDSVTSGDTYFATIRSKHFYSGETLVPYVTGVTIDSTGVTSLDSNFNIITNLRDGSSETYNVSLNPINSNYILKVIGSDSNVNSISKIFVEEMYEAELSLNLSGDTNYFTNGSTVGISDKLTNFNDYKSQFRNAKTPWFVSELKGNKVVPLFRFVTISDGNNANNMFKVSIKNIDKSTLKFDVEIRAIYDTDAKQVILERFTNCTLDPSDGNNYIGSMIGTLDEVYSQKSKYVTIEILDDERVKESVPMGFSGFDVKNINGYGAPSVRYNKTYTDTGSSAAKKPYFGISSEIGIDSDFLTFKGLSGITYTSGFHIQNNVSGVTFFDPIVSNKTCLFDTLDLASETAANNDKRLMKFTTYFTGGFDGWDIFRENRTNTDDFQFNNYIKTNQSFIGDNFQTFLDGELLNNYNIPNVPVSTGITSDFYAYWSAVRSYSDPEGVDINVITTPGIDWRNNGILVNEIIDMVESDRKDCIYIVNTPDKEAGYSDSKSDMISVDQITTYLENSNIDTNYAATYYPWCQYYDSNNDVYLYLSPTRDVVRNMAYTDNVAYPWFATAGFARGSVDCVKVKKTFHLSEEDMLYDNRINLIKNFAVDGVKIWGQKTLQIESGPLDRINIRRLLLYIRKLVRRSSLPLIFEPNDNTTKSKFLEIVNPILQGVKDNRGIDDKYIEIDDSVEAKLRHEMPVKIWIKPIGSLEYIPIEYMITDEGFDFSTLG